MKSLNQHRSIRKYTDKPISESMLRMLITSGQAAASSSFIQAYSIVQVNDSDNRSTIAEAAGGQPWIKNAVALLVICADLYRIDHCCRKTDKTSLDGYTEHFIAATVDAALMAQNLLLAAESEGLGSVFIGGIRNAHDVIADALKLPKLVYPVFGLCLGWPDHDPETKPRMPVEMILHQDQYRSDNIPSNVDEYDALMANYYASRQNNQRMSNWSIQTCEAIQGKKREHMLGFLQQRGFLKL
ncbi:MAG: oxygen-insensitive NADPH nitroreductase [Candidatus Thiodiazotropha sp. (ex Rostrolucina anterorostrata)]|nr:oxygen-insensitive NADPH nitroreductase [Candidatus Thiodiazotropha sp. (ex Rostrolucina anterorostrata)]